MQPVWKYLGLVVLEWEYYEGGCVSWWQWGLVAPGLVAG